MKTLKWKTEAEFDAHMEAIYRERNFAAAALTEITRNGHTFSVNYCMSGDLEGVYRLVPDIRLKNGSGSGITRYSKKGYDTAEEALAAARAALNVLVNDPCVPNVKGWSTRGYADWKKFQDRKITAQDIIDNR
jgi:hypothetical protein